MDVIKVTESNIVIIMTAQDMIKYNISAKELEMFGAAVRRTLKKALNDAARGYDFHVEKGALVRVFSSKEGGCEMFVTSISHNIAFSESDNYLHTVSKYIYRFCALDSLLAACSVLRDTENNTDGSAAYADREKKGRYYLELCGEAPLLCEFGAKKLSERDGVSCYLSEHCRKICDNAVSILGGLA